jgi:hypothetical protein
MMMTSADEKDRERVERDQREQHDRRGGEGIVCGGGGGGE